MVQGLKLQQLQARRPATELAIDIESAGQKIDIAVGIDRAAEAIEVVRKIIIGTALQ